MAHKGILAAIEELRLGMYCIASTKGSVEDQEVLAASRKLDCAINCYYRVKGNDFQNEAV